MGSALLHDGQPSAEALAPVSAFDHHDSLGSGSHVRLSIARVYASDECERVT
jgi:hypothetical protein